MKFACENCKTKYSIADEKVRRKVLKIRCKTCGNVVTVRDTHSVSLPSERPLDRAFDAAFTADAAASGSAGAPRRASRVIPRVEGAATAPSAEAPIVRLVPRLKTGNVPFAGMPPPPPGGKLAADESAAPSEDEWYLAVEGHQYGPMPLAELQARLRRGEASGDDHVWSDGFEAWWPARDVPELRSHFHLRPPPLREQSSARIIVSGDEVLPAHGRRESGLFPTMSAADMPGAGLGTSNMRVATPYQGVAPDQSMLQAGHPSTPMYLPGQVVQQSQASPWLFVGVIVISLVAIGSLTVAVYALIKRSGPAPTEVAAAQPAAAAPAAIPAVPEAAPPGPSPAAEPTAPVEIDPNAITRSNAPSRSGTKSRAGGGASQARAPAAMTDEQKRLAELMGGGGGEASPDIRPTAPSAPVKKNVTSGDIDKVRIANQNALKICYERAAKRDPTLKQVRIDVSVAVAPGGRVSSVQLSSQRGTQLGDCLLQTIKRWDFPNTGEDYDVGFPIIFQGG